MANGNSNKSKASNVKVVVRVRPSNSQELENGCKNVVKVIDDNMLVFDPKTDLEASRYGGRAPIAQRRQRSAMEKRQKDLRFAFDRVFNENATNQEVFECTTFSVVDSLLQGYNCSVFAYGATSAGKTHTMLGSSNQPGVIFLTMMDLYKKIYEKTDEFTCDVSVSYLEIYNENARDLLNPSSKALAVREDPQKGVCVSGLTLHKPQNAEELFSMLEFGNQNRTQHPTDANKQSSRSHAVFQVFVRQQPKGSGLSTDVKVAKMSLIDLAGSERATVTTNRGARFREGANINRSLLALGNCINALAENKPMKGKKEIHIPYRDSKLTRLLKDSLGGNCKTIMIAAVSPSSTCYEDTYNTLKYADRAKKIKSDLKSNVISVDFHVSKYAKIVEELKQQVDDLKNKVKRYESGDATPMKQQRLIFTQREQLAVIQDEFYGVYKDRCLIRKYIIDCEAAEKELKIKLFKRERNFERLQLLVDRSSPIIEQFSQKLDKFRMATSSKQSQLKMKSQTYIKQLADNDEKISVVQSRADDWLSSLVDKSLKDHFTHFHEARVADVEKVSAKAQTRHLKRYALLQEKDAISTERLVSKLLCLVKRQFTTLKENSVLSIDIEHEYTSILEDLEGGKRIMWADETTRENLDVASILNFASCTPVRTPARTHSVFLPNTPQRAASEDLKKRTEGDYEFITAKNSYFNSRKGGQNAAGFIFDSESKEFRNTNSTTVEKLTTNEPRGYLKRQFVQEPSLPSPPKSRALDLDANLELCAKVARFDPDMLPQVPASEPSSPIEPASPIELKPLEDAALHSKDRRGTIVLQRKPEEARSLPVVTSSVAPEDDIAAGEAEIDAPATTQLEVREKHAANEDVGVDESRAQDIIETKKMLAPSTLNATFDVMSSDRANLPLASADHDLSGVEPILDTPDRKPLSLLCENKLKGDSNSIATTAIKTHGLFSMRNASSFKTSKSITHQPSTTESEAPKQENPKVLGSAPKSASAKSKYASIASRLYEGNPRYTPSGNGLKAKQRTERRRRSNTLNNPIRLRDSRRRSRSSTASTPYNLQASKKNLPNHLLGVRKAVEQMGALKGHKRAFAPVASSAVMKAMPSSAL